ncbi:Protein tyrosine phosphatase type IVA 3 [Trichinella pseudospiralis]|uniref:Protein tyrosine phosphatase type IVA 3 n=1 Tax=Trichinella pseudospiralis TaxID=6337 RepID=A0A0V0XY42_TRIPS|nr:Protein tyrosine phosphatase type IVA 3 [Trichinella pseudospiralis]
MARSSIMSHSNHRTTPPNNYYKPAPAEISYGHMRFLITDRPSDATMGQFLEELKRHQVHIVVRVCEPTYSVEELKQHGIEVVDWEFPDGMSPPKEIRDRWIELLKERFVAEPGTCIAVHCVAGLGRAPVLVALALMEAGLQFEDAVDLIRQNRRGAINQKQLYYLEKYKSSGELKRFRNGKRERECVIM